jgi:hypothetical protein
MLSPDGKVMHAATAAIAAENSVTADQISQAGPASPVNEPLVRPAIPNNNPEGPEPLGPDRDLRSLRRSLLP